jgi:hypothetical protein
MYHLTEAYLMSALICLLAVFLGAMCFAFFAINERALVLKDASGAANQFDFSMRVHRSAAWCATFFTLAIAIGSTFSAVPVVYTLLVVSLSGLMSVLYLLAWRVQHAVHHAEAAGRTARLQPNQRAAKLLLAGGMLMTVGVIVALVYVLPGHFTYYPTGYPNEPAVVDSKFTQSV